MYLNIYVSVESHLTPPPPTLSPPAAQCGVWCHRLQMWAAHPSTPPPPLWKGWKGSRQHQGESQLTTALWDTHVWLCRQG